MGASPTQLEGVSNVDFPMVILFFFPHSQFSRVVLEFSGVQVDVASALDLTSHFNYLYLLGASYGPDSV